MRRLLAAAAIAALTLTAAACGDDDESTSTRPDTTATAASDDEPAADTTTIETTDADSTTVETMVDSTDAPDTEPDDTDAAPVDTDDPDDDDGPVVDLTEECEALRLRFEDQFDANTDFSEFADVFDEVKEITPDEIDDELEVLADAYSRLGEIIDEHGGNLTEAMADPEVLQEMEALNSPEVQEASENVQEFFNEACPTVG